MYQNNIPGKNNVTNNTLNPNNYQPSSTSSGSNNSYTINAPQQNLLNMPYQPKAGTYTSMLSPQNTTSGGFSKLENMGRVIKEEPDPVIRVNEAPASQTFNNPNTLSFRGANDRPKMSSSVIFPKSEDNNFSFQPSFTGGFGTSRL